MNRLGMTLTAVMFCTGLSLNAAADRGGNASLRTDSIIPVTYSRHYYRTPDRYPHFGHFLPSPRAYAPSYGYRSYGYHHRHHRPHPRHQRYYGLHGYRSPYWRHPRSFHYRYR